MNDVRISRRGTMSLSMILKMFLVAGVALSLGLSAACTARYSQSLSGQIPNSKGTLVSSSATGLSVFGIAFNEPTPAHEQVMQLIGACRSLNAVQVDYREKVFVIVGIPEISVKATCIQ
jgi:hypothetical protein